jgi:spoIIIJ-associated protein
MSGESAQEFSGKSVDEAIAEGLRALGLRSDQVDVEVINKGSRGLFGLGSEPAVVRLSRRSAEQPAAAKPVPAPAAPAPAAPAEEVATPEAPAADPESAAPRAARPVTERAGAEPAGVDGGEAAPADIEGDDEIAALASDMLSNVVRLMGFDADVASEWRDADDITEERHLLLSISGREASALIGRRGETLENLQYVLRLMVNQRMHRWLNIIVDVEEYRVKRVEHLTHLAQRMADQVASTGRSFALEPMPANERRIVHLALRDDTRIFTESTGEGERRKVNIFPRK